MKNKKAIRQTGSPDNLCARIKEDAMNESKKIIALVEEKAAQIIEAAEKEAFDLSTRVLEQAHQEAAGQEKVALSTLNLETRKIKLLEQEKIVNLVIEELSKKAAEFRSRKEYPGYLKDLIIEASLVVDCKEMDIMGSISDTNILNRHFIDKIEKELKEKYSKDISLEFIADDTIKDIGVVLKSRDNRIEYENTFTARLSRTYDEIRIDILKEAFKENA
jgi:vacuolar-type H+-ATPase subunit E/Vma4